MYLRTLVFIFTSISDCSLLQGILSALCEPSSEVEVFKAFRAWAWILLTQSWVPN